MSPDDQSPDHAAGLVAKLAEAAGAMERIPKRGRHPQGWTYMTEADVADAVRTALAARGVVIVPRLEDHQVEEIGRTSSGNPIWRTTIGITFTVMDGEASIEIPWAGQADDSSDKGLQSAITAARKSLLVSLFNIASGDEPGRPQEQRQQGRARHTDEAAAGRARDERPISEAQRERLWAIANAGELDETTVRRVVAFKTEGRAFDPEKGRPSVSKITRADYDAVIDAIKAYPATREGAEETMKRWEEGVAQSQAG